jgi:hypothetical protein
LAVAAGQPGCRERVRLICIDEIEALLLEQLPQAPRRADPARSTADSMHADARLLSARCNGGIAHGNDFREVTAPH